MTSSDLDHIASEDYGDARRLNRRRFLKNAGKTAAAVTIGAHGFGVMSDAPAKEAIEQKCTQGAFGMEDVRYPQIKAYLCNNRRWQKTIKHPFGGDEMTNKGFPALVVDVRGLPCAGLWKFGATAFNREKSKLAAFESSAASQNGCIHQSWELDDPLPNPWTVNVWAAQGSYRFEETTGLRAYRVSGKVTDFEGKPIEAVVQACVPGVATSTNGTGSYELWLPDRHIPWLMALDSGYGKSTLECWAYDYLPQSDLELDLRIGQVELYELRAWRGFCGIKIDFLPMSVGLVNAMTEGKESARDNSISPRLSSKDVEVRLDDKLVDILSLHRREEICKPGDTPVSYSREEYALQVADTGRSPSSPRGSVQVLRVAVRHDLKEAGSSVVERGEGLYLGLRAGVGVSSGSV